MRTGVMKKSISVLLAAAVAVTMLLSVTALQTSEAQAASKGKLVKSVKVYYKKGGKWKLLRSETYSYNKKKDPVKITRKGEVFKGKKRSFSTTKKYMKWTYSAGKRSSMKQYTKEAGQSKQLDLIATYDKKGRRISSDYYYDNELVEQNTLKYNKKNFLKWIQRDDSRINFKYKYHKNKLPKALRGKSRYTTQLTTFNKKGYAKHYESSSAASGYIVAKYKYKKGLVKRVMEDSQEGYKHHYLKYVFKYTGKKIPKQRYRAMINGIMAGEGEGSGTYWY